jgi:hypothetical protein
MVFIDVQGLEMGRGLFLVGINGHDIPEQLLSWH